MALCDLEVRQPSVGFPVTSLLSEASPLETGALNRPYQHGRETDEKLEVMGLAGNLARSVHSFVPLAFIHCHYSSWPRSEHI